MHIYMGTYCHWRFFLCPDEQRNYRTKRSAIRWELRLSGSPGQEIPQEDTFFRVPHGRLKLRELSPEQGELIYYEREDARSPKPSRYLVAGTREPAALRAVLAVALGLRGVVRKRRLLYQVGQTRLHLDQVEGLGSFLELEVVLAGDQDTARGTAIAAELMEQLGIAGSDLVPCAYLDLLDQQSARSLMGHASQ
jgi:adenylate cyclase class IV